MSISIISESPECLQSVAEEVDAEYARLRRKWNVYSPAEMQARIAELDSGGFLIDGLFPKRSLSIAVGDSGLGKSPLLYQAAMCFAHGIPFLGFSVCQGRVLYLDFENGLQGVDELTGQLAKHLGIDAIDSDKFLPWNFNDSSQNWSSSKLEEMIGDLRPDWVITDPMSGFDAAIETTTDNAARNLQMFRRIGQKFRLAITGVHHIRKPSDNAQYSGPRLEEDAKTWMLQARGARQLINGSDVRLGTDLASRGASADPSGNLIMAGFARLRGNIGPIHIERVVDDDGEPLGYRMMSGADLLSNPAQQKTFHDLPESFSFKEAKRAYGRADQSTTDFLRKCTAIGILRHEGRTYRKVNGHKTGTPHGVTGVKE